MKPHPIAGYKAQPHFLHPEQGHDHDKANMISVTSVSHSSATDSETCLAQNCIISTDLGAGPLDVRKYCFVGCFAHRYACSVKALLSAAYHGVWMLCSAMIIESFRTNKECLHELQAEQHVSCTTYQSSNYANTKSHSLVSIFSVTFWLTLSPASLQ